MRKGVGTPQLQGEVSLDMQTCIVHAETEPDDLGVVRTPAVVTATTMAIDTESRPPKEPPPTADGGSGVSSAAASCAALAWLSAQSNGTSPCGVGKRPHPEAYQINVQSPRLSFMRRVVQRADEGLAVLSDVQRRQAAALGLLPRRKVSFNLERVEVREYVPTLSSSENEMPGLTELSAIEELDPEGAESDDDSDVSSVASDLPSLVSQSEGSDSEDEEVEVPPAQTCQGCDGEHAEASARSILGRVSCGSRVQASSSLPSGSAIFNVQRPSILSNPFFMRSEFERSKVCDAYEAWWQRGDASVRSVAAEFKVPVAFCWQSDLEACAKDAGRAEAVVDMARLLNRGVDVGLRCCEQGKRCHALTLQASIEREAARLRRDADADVEVRGEGAHSYLIVYAGPRSNKRRLAAKLLLDDPGCAVDELDIANGVGEDVRNLALQAKTLARIAARAYTAVFVAIPCSSYAVVRGQRLRSPSEPEGIAPVPKEWRLYLEKHNALSEFGETIAELCERVGVSWAVENPASRSEMGSDAYWKEFETWGSLWDRPRIKSLQARGAKRYLLPHCAFGSQFQKYIEVMCSPDLIGAADGLFNSVRCTHGKHPDVAVGRDTRGRSKAANTAAYPEELNVVLAALLSSGAKRQKRRLHPGSRKPHGEDALLLEHQRAERWAKPGSLRTLEPELEEVLRIEPLPLTNAPRTSEYVDPPPQPEVVPGPFTTEQLIPAEVVAKVTGYGRQVAKCLDRAKRGKAGWQHARRLRPEPLVFEEHEALNPCGHGFAWVRMHPDEPLTPQSLWKALTPSHWPEDPPCREEGVPLVNAERWSEWAERTGFTDKRIDSWNKHGYPGAGLPNVAVLAPPHVGALKEPTHFEECNKRDLEFGFISPGTSFPAMWPLICDPCNIVVQNGKPRLTIDKSMWISGRTHLPPYNLVIDLDEQGRLYGRLLLVRVWEFTRGAAILMTAASACDPVQLEIAVFDLMAFFRIHPKQRLHMRESGRIMANGFSYDRRPNFGERDAPDHTCAESDGLAWFMKHEMARLDMAYPSRVPSITL